MKKQQAIELTNQYLHLLLTDFSGATELMAEEFVWENFLPQHVPFGGRYEGLAGLESYFSQLAETWTIGEIKFRDFIFDPETRILVTPGVELAGKSLITGRSCNMAFMWEFRFTAAGKISYVREYNDTATIGETYDV